jgi:hypothetical protein
MYNAVVIIHDTRWPAYRKATGMLIDLRLFDAKDSSPQPRLVFRPDVLRHLDIPEELIEAAAKSNPQGFVLFERLPEQALRGEGRAEPSTSEPSTE